MKDETARELLRGAVADAEVNPAPVDGLLRRGAAARRRTRLAQVAGVAAVVAGLIVGGATLTTGDESDPVPIATSTGPSQASGQPEVLQAPEGKRYVGMGRIVVAVPEGWGTNEVRCGTVMRDSVVFDPQAHRDCLAEPTGTPSALHIVSADSPLAASWLQADGSSAEIDGVRLIRTEITPLDSRPVFVAGLVVESEGVILWAEAPDRATVDQILDSARVLPAEYVAIPYNPDVSLETSQYLMQYAGLEVQVVEQYRRGWSPGSLISSDPPLGTAVREDSTVTLSVTGENPDAGSVDAWPPTGPAIERPPAVECVYFYPQDIDAWGTAIDATVTGVELKAPQDGATPATVTLQVNSVLKGSVPTTVEAKVFDADWLLPADPQDAVGVRVITALGEDLSMPACGFTRPWSTGELARWQVAIDGGEDPVTVTDEQLADALHLFALQPSDASIEPIPFSAEVGLGLASEVIMSVPLDHTTEEKADLSDGETWRIDVPHFRGWVGPFTALTYLRFDPAEWQLSTGPHESCVGDVVEPSPELAGYRQLSIQPAELAEQTCISWWSVDLFMDESGRIHAVTLDLYEP